MEAYHAAYAEVCNIIWDIIGRHGKLKELEDEGTTWVSDYCHEISQYMEQTRLELRASCKEADSQEKPKRKEGPKSENAEPLKPKFEPVPRHKLTTAETAMELSEGFTYYEVLGVTPSATTEDITKAYRKIVLKWHPDKGHIHEVSDEVAREAFILINQVYEILKNTELRAKYDAYWKSQESESQKTHKPFRPDMFFPGFKFDDPYKTFARFGTDSSPNFLRTRRTGSTTPSQ
jgi:DnaJ-domain-containing protein 1